MKEVIHIPSLFKKVVEKVDETFSTRATDQFHVYYQYGHYVDLVAHLDSLGRSVSKKGQKYPLIWLVMDFTERYGDMDYEYCELTDLQFIIAVPTKPALSAEQRAEQTFLPRLYPIYKEFLYQLSWSGYFGNADNLEHEKIDRPYWGGQDANGNGQANLFNDYIDAIQLKRVRLNVNESVCDEFKIL